MEREPSLAGCQQATHTNTETVSPSPEWRWGAWPASPDAARWWRPAGGPWLPGDEGKLLEYCGQTEKWPFVRAYSVTWKSPVSLFGEPAWLTLSGRVSIFAVALRGNYGNTDPATSAPATSRRIFKRKWVGQQPSSPPLSEGNMGSIINIKRKSFFCEKWWCNPVSHSVLVKQSKWLIYFTWQTSANNRIKKGSKMMNLCLVSCRHRAKDTKHLSWKKKKNGFQSVIVVLITSNMSLNVEDRIECC